MKMKKKYYEAEAEIVSFENEDIITSSLNTYYFSEGYENIEDGAPDSQNYGSGTNPLWNK